VGAAARRAVAWDAVAHAVCSGRSWRRSRQTAYFARATIAVHAACAVCWISFRTSAFSSRQVGRRTMRWSGCMLLAHLVAQSPRDQRCLTRTMPLSKLCSRVCGAGSQKDPRDERHRGLVLDRLPHHVLPVHGSVRPLPGAGRETRARVCNGTRCAPCVPTTTHDHRARRPRPRRRDTFTL
jgi:hypothetical protein